MHMHVCVCVCVYVFIIELVVVYSNNFLVKSSLCSKKSISDWTDVQRTQITGPRFPIPKSK